MKPRFSSFLLLLLLGKIGLGHRPAFAAPAAMLARVSGQVEVMRGSQKIAGRQGLALQNGDQLVVRNGSATVFSLAAPPRTLQSGAQPISFTVGAASAKATTSVWRGVYEGLSSGLNRRDQRVAAAMRPGSIEMVFPPQSRLETALPRFEWRPGALEAPRYEVVVRGASGILWSGQTQASWLQYPASAPVLRGALSWSVSPLRFENGGWQPIKDWASATAPFQVASPTEIKRIQSQLASLDAQLKSVAPAERLLSRASFLSAQQLDAWALRELGDEKQGEDSALSSLRRALWLKTGQNWRIKSDLPPTVTPQGRADRQILAYSATSPLKVDNRKVFAAPDGSFGLEVPAHWSVSTYKLPSNVTLSDFAAEPASLTRLSVTVGAAASFKTSGSLLKFVAEFFGKASGFSASPVQTSDFRGSKVPQVAWKQVSGAKTQRGEMFEWRHGARVYVLALGGPNAATLSTLRRLWNQFAPTATPKPVSEMPTVAEISPAIDVILSDMQKVNARADVLMFEPPTSADSAPSETEFAALDAKQKLVAAGSHERADSAMRAAQTAFRLGWAAGEKGDVSEAKRWLNRSAALHQASYDAEKAATEAELRADATKLSRWESWTPPQAASQDYTLALDSLRNLMAMRLNPLRALAESQSDWATVERCNRQLFAIRRLQLDNARLDGADNETLWSDQIKVATVLRLWGGLAQQKGDFAGARAYYKCALAWRSALPATYAERAVETALLDLGKLETDSGDNLAARDFYQQGIAAMDAAKDARTELVRRETSEEWRQRYRVLVAQRYAILFNNIGVCEINLGDFNASHAAFEHALAAVEELPKDGFAGNVRASLRATTFSNQSSLASYESDANQNLSLLEQALGENNSIQNEAGLAANNFNSAQVLFNKGDFARAQIKNEVARTLFEQIQDSHNLIGATQLASSLLWHQGDISASNRMAQDALQMARSFGHPEDIASSARLVVRNRLKTLGDKALSATEEKELSALLAEAEGADAQTGIVLGQIETLGLRSTIRRKMGDLEGALALLQAAIARIERLRATARSAEEFADSPSIYSYYDGAVSLLLKLNRPDEAFDMLSRARSKKLNDTLSISALKSNDPALQKLVERSANLQQKLFRTRELLATEVAMPALQRDPAKTEALRGLVASTQAEFFQVSDALKSKNPRFDRAVTLSPLELKKSQRVIPAGTLLLEYAVLDDGLYIFAVTRNSLKIFAPRVSRADLDRAIRSYRGAIDADIAHLTKGEAISSIDGPSPLRAASEELSGWLLAPIQTEIDAAQTVAIVPSGSLFYLPFHALGEADKDGQWHFLIESKPVAYLAVGDVLAATGERSDSDLGHGVLALGDPTGANLPAARSEVESIVRFFPTSESLVGAQASKAALFSPSSLEKRVLHIAAHGVLDSARPEQSFIQLSATPNDDGKLRLGEIRGNDLNRVDLVTLSACRTAIGQGEPDGLEIASLAQAFSSAGTSSVIASLWNVEDNSTSNLMKAFYGALADGLPKGNALQKAQKTLLADPKTRHPVFWAPFELLGDWR